MDSTLLPSSRNEEVKALVSKVKPAIDAHIQAAQNRLDGTAK